MKHLGLVLTLITLFFTHPALACEERACITISNAYAYATTSIQKNGAIFMQINNSGPDSKITGASTAIAQRTELHTHIMDGDIMMMREVEAYDMPSGETLTLEPMGHHIMLMGLTAPLKVGDIFPLTLMIENIGPLETEITIQSPGHKPSDPPTGTTEPPPSK